MEMTVRVKDILSLLEEVAPRRLAEKWDNSGLQVGSLKGEVTKIMFSLDPCIEAVNQASGAGAEVLITHHPLIFSPLKSVSVDSFPGEVVSFALEKGISLISAHTNLDRARYGINDALAEILELRDPVVLEEYEGGEREGIGRVGTLEKTLTLADFGRYVGQRLACKSLSIIGSADASINRVAVVGGSGGSFVGRARSVDADCLVTGDVGYHHALAAWRDGICVIDAGHFHTEKAALRVVAWRFQAMLESREWEISVGFFDAQISPVFNLSA